ncbi:ROK family transcriptional regulator [Microbacterium sp. YY-01]|uniref:ROK family transcriptional regulator n=1 Tax=Microbacterium sp. YY-01 TaxID=3421634 RepID=UPI003D1676F9
MSTLTPNAQRLLRELIVHGPGYRADLARSLDVSRATVTNLVNRLSADGWVEEVDAEPGVLKNLLGTTPQLGVLASLMFLVDTCSVTIATLDGRVLKELTVSGQVATVAAERIAAGADLVERLVGEVGLHPDAVLALHLAVDTQMDSRSGDVYAQRASSRWYGVNPKAYLSERFGVPVYTQNTARLEGLAEYLWGRGHGHDNVLYVDVSYGVTSGHVLDGILQSGARGGSGELGHTVYDWNGPLCTCGNAGCLMQYVSIPAMLRDDATAAGAPSSWQEFCDRVRSAEASAVGIVDRAAEVLGRMLVNTCHVIDPALVVLSGEVPRALPGFVDAVAVTVRDRALPLVGRHVQIVAAELDDMYASTARAGIESLRAVDDVVAAATAL